MKILGRTQMINAIDYQDAISRLMACGFDGIEINIYNREFVLRDEVFAPGFVEKITDILRENHVNTYIVGAHCDYMGDDERFSLIKKVVAITAAIKAPLMIITGGMKQEGMDEQYLWDENIKRTKELCIEAEKYDIKLALEFEPGFIIDSTKLALKAIREINSPALALNADVGHIFLQDENPMEAIENSGAYIIHTHFENMEKGVHNHLLPDIGDMDLPQYIKKLKAVGFTGDSSLDVYQYDYEKIAPQAIRYLKSII